MPKALAAALVLAALLGSLAPAEARHRHRGAHAWCRADAAQMFGVARRAVHLGHRQRKASGRFEIRGSASHGALGRRPFVCHFDTRGRLQGAV